MYVRCYSLRRGESCYALLCEEVGKLFIIGYKKGTKRNQIPSGPGWIFWPEMLMPQPINLPSLFLPCFSPAFLCFEEMAGYGAKLDILSLSYYGTRFLHFLILNRYNWWKWRKMQIFVNFWLKRSLLLPCFSNIWKSSLFMPSPGIFATEPHLTQWTHLQLFLVVAKVAKADWRIETPSCSLWHDRLLLLFFISKRIIIMIRFQNWGSMGRQLLGSPWSADMTPNVETIFRGFSSK